MGRFFACISCLFLCLWLTGCVTPTIAPDPTATSELVQARTPLPVATSGPGILVTPPLSPTSEPTATPTATSAPEAVSSPTPTYTPPTPRPPYPGPTDTMPVDIAT